MKIAGARRVALTLATLFSVAVVVFLGMELNIRSVRNNYLSQLDSQEPTSRMRAIRKLQNHAVRWFGYDRATVAALTRIIETDPERDVVGTAVLVLKEIGGSRIPNVRDFYKNLFLRGDDWQKYLAACQLYHQEPDKLAYVIEHFPDQDASTRHSLLLGLTVALGDERRDLDVSRLEPLFILGLNDDDPRVRTSAAVGLHAVGTTTAFHALRDRLIVETDTGVRFTIKRLLGDDVETPEPEQRRTSAIGSGVSDNGSCCHLRATCPAG